MDEQMRAWFQAMEQRLTRTEAVLNETQGELRQSEERGRAMAGRIAQLQAERTATTQNLAAPALAEPAPVEYFGAKEWKPPKWEGSVASFPDYLARLRASYRTRAGLRPALSADVYWNSIYESIKDDAKRSRMRHYWHAGTESLVKDPADFITEIERVFGDSNEKGAALEKLVNLRHEVGQPWRDHQRIFDGLLLTAGGDHFPDDVKITHLRNSMSNPIKLNLVSMPKIAEYPRYVEEVDRITTNYEETEQFKKPHKTWKAKNAHSGDGMTAYGPPVSGIKNARVDAEGDTAMTATKTQPFGGRRKGVGDRDQRNAPATKSNGKRARWVTQAEMDKRKEKGLCYRCGAEGHRANQCPYLPAQKPVAINRVAVGPMLESSDEDSDSGTESGEE